MDNNYVISWLARGTSPVDWCESNYTVTPHIAEFFNTISNVVFLLIPAACSQLWYSYAHNVSRGIHLVLGCFIVVGLSSAYFHATLSLLGQLLDELSILWILMVSYSIFTPQKYRPKMLKGNSKLFQMIIASFGIIITCGAFWKPEINQYALFVTAVPAVVILVCEIKSNRNKKIALLGTMNLIMLALAVTVWVSDRFLCDKLSEFNLYFLHGLWHIFIFIASYNTQVLMCYFHALHDVPESKPDIRFWPYNWKHALPYVQCKSKNAIKCP